MNDRRPPRLRLFERPAALLVDEAAGLPSERRPPPRVPTAPVARPPDDGAVPPPMRPLAFRPAPAQRDGEDETLIRSPARVFVGAAAPARQPPPRPIDDPGPDEPTDPPAEEPRPVAPAPPPAFQMRLPPVEPTEVPTARVVPVRRDLRRGDAEAAPPAEPATGPGSLPASPPEPASPRRTRRTVPPPPSRSNLRVVRPVGERRPWFAVTLGALLLAVGLLGLWRIGAPSLDAALRAWWREEPAAVPADAQPEPVAEDAVAPADVVAAPQPETTAPAAAPAPAPEPPRAPPATAAPTAEGAHPGPGTGRLRIVSDRRAQIFVDGAASG